MVFSLPFFHSCKKEDTLLAQKMTAKVNGTEWSAFTRATTIKNNKIHILGASSSGSVIELTTLGTDIKTYTLNLSLFDTTRAAECEGLYKAGTSVNTSDMYIAKKGSITISTHNTKEKTVSGSFHLQVYKLNIADSLVLDSISITDGTFKELKYTE